MKLARILTDQGLSDAVVVDTDDGAGLLPVPPDLTPERVAADPGAYGRLLPIDGVRFAAPIRPGKIVCIGLNYADHAAESSQQPPEEPILFLKATDTVIGARDDIIVPRGSAKTDWEVELGVVIGGDPAGTAYLRSEQDARRCIAGYVLVNDVSERAFQLERGGQWDKGKNCATFCPLGPWIRSADEVPDPQALRLGLEINGEPVQESSTSKMIFGVYQLVHYVSQFMTLYPGDVISTGTPAGVGAGQRPPRYLTDGDTVRAWAEGLGEQRNRVRAG